MLMKGGSDMTGHTRFRQLSIVLFCLFLIVLVIHMESNVRFNRQVNSVHGNDAGAAVNMAIDAREDSTSTWLKRSFPMNDGTLVDLTGQTIDGTLRNGSDDILHDWELRINIAGDCFINQAWNGEVEIHQFTGTEKEKVQRLNLGVRTDSGPAAHSWKAIMPATETGSTIGETAWRTKRPPDGNRHIMKAAEALTV